MIEKINDDFIYKCLNIIYNEFGNENVIIGGSIALYLQGIILPRNIKDFDIAFINNELPFDCKDINDYSKLLVKNNIPLTLDILIKFNGDSFADEHINNIKFKDLNVKVYNYKYIIKCKLDAIQVLEQRMNKYLHTYNLLQNNDCSYKCSDEEIDYLYELFKCVLKEFPNKQVVFTGSAILCLLGVNLDRPHNKDLDCYFIGEHYKSDKDNPYKQKYKSFFRENLGLDITLDINLKNELPSNEYDYLTIKIKDIDVNIATLEHIAEYNKLYGNNYKKRLDKNINDIKYINEYCKIS